MSLTTPGCQVSVLECLMTCAVLLAALNSGANLGIFNPTFPDMEILTGSTTSQMSSTMAVMGIASMVGAFALSPLFDRFNGNLVLAITLVLQGVALGLAPWCPQLIGYQIMCAATMICNFGILAGCFIFVCKIWQKRPKLIGAMIQATDMIHVLGVALSPQIVHPFIGHVYTIAPPHHQFTTPVTPNSNLTTNLTRAASILWQSEDDDGTITSGVTTEASPEMVSTALNSSVILVDRSRLQPVEIGYAVMALFDGAVGALCLVIYFVCLIHIRRKRLAFCRSLATRRRSRTLNEEDLRRVKRPAETGGAVTGAGSEGIESGASDADLSLLPRPIRRSRSLEKLNLLCTHPLLVRDVPTITDLRRPSRIQLSGDSSTTSASSSSNLLHRSTRSFVNRPPPLSCTAPIVTTLTIIVMFFVVNGARDTLLIGFLFTYVSKSLQWTTTAGTALVTAYHVARVVVHVGVVAIAGCVSAAALTVINLVVMIATSVLMTVAVHLDPIYFAVGVLLGAIATSNMNPTAMTLARDAFTVNGRTTGLFIGAMALGQCIISPVVGYLLDLEGPLATYGFPGLLLILSVLDALLLVPWMLLARWMRNRRAENSVSERRKQQMADDADMEVVFVNEATEKSPLLKGK